MGSIISSRRSSEQSDKVIVEVLLDYDEFLQLRGNLNDVRLFTEKVADVKTTISQRGKNEATKYFLIPRQYRRGFRYNNKTSCQRIDLKDKVIFVYVVDKLNISPSRRELVIKKMEENYR